MPNHQGSIKQCPALPDFFSQGFVIPMWMDSDLIFDSETSQWVTGSSPLFQDWTAHGNQQLLDYANAKSATKQSAKFVEGEYLVEVYNNGFKIGEGKTTLKKGGLF